MIRSLIVLLLIVGFLIADVQLVNDYRVIIIKDGQKFSINDDSKKYQFVKWGQGRQAFFVG